MVGQMYSDAGLLGAMVVCEASSAGKVVGAVAAALRNAQASKCFMTSLLFHNYWFSWLPFHGIPKTDAWIKQVTDEEVAAAKKNMLADVYTMLEAPLNQIENMGSQVNN